MSAYAERVESLRNPSDKTFEDRTPDGSVHRIRRRRVATGGTVSVMTDITERKRAEQELAEQKTLLDAVFEHMDQGVVMYDRDMIVTAFNAYAAAGRRPAVR